MIGYVVHHKSATYGDVLADYFRNDPYVWFSPYLWSFCHLKQNPRIERGMTILWITKANNTFVCDLVFVVGEIIPFREARSTFYDLDAGLARDHFDIGTKHHPEVWRDGANTYLADMERSYIPHPAVSIEVEVDEMRRAQNPTAKPLSVVCKRPSPPLRFEEIERLEQVVCTRAVTRITGALNFSHKILTDSSDPDRQSGSRRCSDSC